MRFMDASQYNESIFEEGRFGEQYDKLSELRTMKIIELLKGFKGEFLDIGCGDGAMALQIKNSLKCRVEGIELVEKNVKAAQAKGLKVTKVDLNREKLPYNDSTFDGILAGEVIEHIIDSEGFLLEAKRILKKDGVLILTVPNVAAWYNRFLLMFGYVPHWVESGTKKAYGTPFGKVNGHVKAFTKKSLVQMLDDYEFKVVKINGSGFNKSLEQEMKETYGSRKINVAGKVFFVLENLFSRRSSLATNILVKAVKK